MRLQTFTGWMPAGPQGPVVADLEYSQATRRGHMDLPVVALELPHGAHPEECEAELAEDAAGYAPPRPVLRPVADEWGDTWDDDPAEELAVSTDTFARRRFKQREQVPLHVQFAERRWADQPHVRRRRSA